MEQTRPDQGLETRASILLIDQDPVEEADEEITPARVRQN